MDLEPHFGSLQDGQRVDCVVEVILSGPGYSVLTTKIHGTTILSDVKLDKGKVFTLFGMKKWQISNQLWLLKTDNSVVLQHLPKDVKDLLNMTEVCSGIGAVTEGYKACGATTKTYNEKNAVFTSWLKTQNKLVVEGDISDPQVVANLSQVVGSSLSGGYHVSLGAH